MCHCLDTSGGCAARQAHARADPKSRAARSKAAPDRLANVTATRTERAVVAKPLDDSPVFRCARCSVAFSHLGYDVGAYVPHIQPFVVALEIVEQ